MTMFPGNIKAGDLFHAQYLNYQGELKHHYFYCVYTQQDDVNNNLASDIVGLLISTNEKFAKLEAQGFNDYNVSVEINGRKAWVCADKMYRFMLTDATCNIEKKNTRLTQKEKEEVLSRFTRFYLETTRQMLEYEK